MLTNGVTLHNDQQSACCVEQNSMFEERGDQQRHKHSHHTGLAPLSWLSASFYTSSHIPLLLHCRPETPSQFQPQIWMSSSEPLVTLISLLSLIMLNSPKSPLSPHLLLHDLTDDREWIHPSWHYPPALLTACSSFLLGFGTNVTVQTSQQQNDLPHKNKTQA